MRTSENSYQPVSIKFRSAQPKSLFSQWDKAQVFIPKYFLLYSGVSPKIKSFELQHLSEGIQNPVKTVRWRFLWNSY